MDRWLASGGDLNFDPTGKLFAGWMPSDDDDSEAARESDGRSRTLLAELDEGSGRRDLVKQLLANQSERFLTNRQGLSS